MKRLVLDSNILISAFFWDGKERSILKDCKVGKYHLIISDFILQEVERVLQEKFVVESSLVRSYIREIFKFSELVIVRGKIDLVKEDPSDNNILETALIGNAEIVVTGDNHLLKIGTFNKNILMIKSSELLP